MAMIFKVGDALHRTAAIGLTLCIIFPQIILWPPASVLYQGTK